MKRTVFVLSTLLVVFVAVFAVLVLRPVRKVKAGKGCSDASLYGNYALVISGMYEDYAWDFSMLATFDGQGGLSGSDLIGVYDGKNWGGGPLTFTGGTYKVNRNCTCTLTIPSGVSVFDTYEVYFYGVVIDTGGDEAVGTTYLAEDFAGTFDAKRLAEGKWSFLE
jgi:hypothetical protein